MLPQSCPGNWFHTIDPVLISIGYVPRKSDTCIYIYDHDRIIIILTLYVDDLLVIGGDIQLIEKIKRKLMDQFKMTDMGDVSLVLGMQVTRDRQGKTLTISQENYTKSILERFGMADCKPSSTPGFGSELSTKQPEGTLLNKEETQRYQAITGSVMYLAQITRYDIMSSSGQLARAMSKPHGCSETSSALFGWNHEFYHRLQAGRFQAHSLLRLQLGQQPRQRQINVVLHHDVVQGSSQL